MEFWLNVFSGIRHYLRDIRTRGGIVLLHTEMLHVGEFAGKIETLGRYADGILLPPYPPSLAR